MLAKLPSLASVPSLPGLASVPSLAKVPSLPKVARIAAFGVFFGLEVLDFNRFFGFFRFLHVQVSLVGLFSVCFASVAPKK